MVTIYLQMVAVSRNFLVAFAFTPYKMAVGLKQIRNERLKNIYKLWDIIAHSNESWYVFARGDPFIFNGIPIGFNFKGIHD